MIHAWPGSRSFERFKSAILRWSGEKSPTPDFLLSSLDYQKRSGAVVKLEEFYIPFDFINEKAVLMVIGLTPGKTQWAEAVRAAQSALEAGCSEEEVLRRAKLTGAFAKKIRTNLLAMMETVGLGRLLGVEDMTTLFDENAHLVHWTSAFVDPILADGGDFNGTQAPIKMSNDFFRQSFEEGVLQEIAACPHALLLPLGKVPDKLFAQLADAGKIDRSRVLLGMPHPSGASAERVACWIGTKTEGFSAKTNPEDIFRARDAMAKQIAGMAIAAR